MKIVIENYQVLDAPRMIKLLPEFSSNVYGAHAYVTCQCCRVSFIVKFKDNAALDRFTNAKFNELLAKHGWGHIGEKYYCSRICRISQPRKKKEEKI